MLAALLPLADSAEEGKKILIAMLLTGLTFVGVIALGELSKWAGHRRRARARGARGY